MIKNTQDNGNVNVNIRLHKKVLRLLSDIEGNIMLLQDPYNKDITQYKIYTDLLRKATELLFKSINIKLSEEDIKLDITAYQIFEELNSISQNNTTCQYNG